MTMMTISRSAVVTGLVRAVVAVFAVFEMSTYFTISDYLQDPCDQDDLYCARYRDNDDDDEVTDCEAFRKLYLPLPWMPTLSVAIYGCIAAAQVAGQIESCASQRAGMQQQKHQSLL